METVVAIPAIIGLINGFDLLVKRNWEAFAKFVIAVVAGITLGYLHWVGLSGAEMGFLVGLASSGYYKGAQVLGAIKVKSDNVS